MDSDIKLLRDDGSGGVRIGQSRVLLEIVIGAYQDGEIAETIAAQYFTVTVEEVRAVIAHFMQHKDEVEAYLMRREMEGQEVWRRIEARQRDLGELKTRLKKCRADRASGETQDQT